MMRKTIATEEDFNNLIEKFHIESIKPTEENIRAVCILGDHYPNALLGISNELNDADLMKYSHGTRSTYVNHKCNGTLCKHANKMAARKRNKTQDRLYTGVDEALDIICASLNPTGR